MDVEEVSGHATRREQWRIGGLTFDLTWPADADALLDSPATHARFARDEYMPYWAQPWPASVLLAEAVLAGPPGEGRDAVEIGCGIGLVSVAAARMGWSVVAGDYDQDALAFAALNAARNDVVLSAVRLIDFRTPLPEPVFDHVLAADLVYERRNCEPLARWIQSALRPGGEALVADPNRSAGDGFALCATQVGFDVRETAVTTTAPAGLLQRARIWRLRHAR